MSNQMPGDAVPMGDMVPAGLGAPPVGVAPAGVAPAGVAPAGVGVVPGGVGVVGVAPGGPAELVPTGAGAGAGVAAGAGSAAGDGRSIDLLYTVDMAVTVELGRTRMSMRDLLALRPGKVIELDRSARAPVDILVNNTLLAHGEVVVVDEELGVRVTEIAGSPIDRAAG